MELFEYDPSMFSSSDDWCIHCLTPCLFESLFEIATQQNIAMTSTATAIISMSPPVRSEGGREGGREGERKERREGGERGGRGRERKSDINKLCKKAIFVGNLILQIIIIKMLLEDFCFFKNYNYLQWHWQQSVALTDSQ